MQFVISSEMNSLTDNIEDTRTMVAELRDCALFGRSGF